MPAQSRRLHYAVTCVVLLVPPPSLATVIPFAGFLVLVRLILYLPFPRYVIVVAVPVAAFVRYNFRFAL